MQYLTRETPMVHLRVDGRSQDVPLDRLRLGARPDPGCVRQAVARYLEMPTDALASYAVDTWPGGSIVVRPEAVFG